MDSKTYEYMNDRVTKFAEKSKEIEQLNNLKAALTSDTYGLESIGCQYRNMPIPVGMLDAFTKSLIKTTDEQIEIVKKEMEEI